MGQQSDQAQSADQLFLVAHHLYKTARDAMNKRELPSSYQVYMSPNVCILFSVMAAEAFINETKELAAFPQCADDPQEIKEFAQSAFQETRQSPSLYQKYMSSHTILSGGQRPSSKKGVYSDLILLAELRNLLAHVKPSWERAEAATDGGTGTNQIQRVLGKLEQKGLLQGKPIDWVCKACCWPVAEWAIQTASGSAKKLVSIIPSGWFQDRMEHICRATFVEQWPA